MDALVNAEEAPPGARFCNDLADRYVVRRWGEINGRVMGIVATETYAKCLVTGEVSRVYGEDADVFETSGHKEFGERWMYHVYVVLDRFGYWDFSYNLSCLDSRRKRRSSYGHQG